MLNPEVAKFNEPLISSSDQMSRIGVTNPLVQLGLMAATPIDEVTEPGQALALNKALEGAGRTGKAIKNTFSSPAATTAAQTAAKSTGVMNRLGAAHKAVGRVAAPLALIEQGVHGVRAYTDPKARQATRERVGNLTLGQNAVDSFTGKGLANIATAAKDSGQVMADNGFADVLTGDRSIGNYLSMFPEGIKAVAEGLQTLPKSQPKKSTRPMSGRMQRAKGLAANRNK